MFYFVIVPHNRDDTPQDPTEHKKYGCGQNIHKIHWESHLLPEHLKYVQELWYRYLKSFIWVHVRHECITWKTRETCVAQMLTHARRCTGTGLES